jgi:hypothetical protein
MNYWEVVAVVVGGVLDLVAWFLPIAWPDMRRHFAPLQSAAIVAATSLALFMSGTALIFWGLE